MFFCARATISVGFLPLFVFVPPPKLLFVRNFFTCEIFSRNFAKKRENISHEWSFVRNFNVFERGKKKIFFFYAILILYVLSLFLYLSPKTFIRAKFFHVRNIFAKFCEKTRKNFARTIIRAKFYVLLEGDNLYLFLITTAPFLTRATKKTFSKQWNFITGCSCRMES